MKKILGYFVSVALSIVCVANVPCVATEDDSYVVKTDVFFTSAYDADRPDIVYDNSIKCIVTFYSNYTIDIELSPVIYESAYDEIVCLYSVPFSVSNDYYTKYGANLARGKDLTSRYSYLVNSGDVESYMNYNVTTSADTFYTYGITATRQYSAYFSKDVTVKQPVFGKYNRTHRISINCGSTAATNGVASLFGQNYYLPDVYDNTSTETSTDTEIKDTSLNNSSLCGDTDADGKVSISDSIILNRYLAGTVDSLPCSDPPPLAPEDNLDDE